MRKIIIAAIFFLLPFLVFAQDNPAKKKAYFFYLDTCPHCHNVDKYFTDNGIYDKYDIEKLDAKIPVNGQFLDELYAANNFPEEQRGGVPVVAFVDKFIVGDQPAIDNFVKDIDASDNAFELPDPEGGVSASDLSVHDGPISTPTSTPNPAKSDVSANTPSTQSTDTGNKKNFFPVIIAAIIIIGAGALIFTNRNS
jgi:hypothetical protein